MPNFMIALHHTFFTHNTAMIPHSFYSNSRSSMIQRLLFLKTFVFILIYRLKIYHFIAFKKKNSIREK